MHDFQAVITWEGHATLKCLHGIMSMNFLIPPESFSLVKMIYILCQSTRVQVNVSLAYKIYLEISFNNIIKYL